MHLDGDRGLQPQGAGARTAQTAPLAALLPVGDGKRQSTGQLPGSPSWLHSEDRGGDCQGHSRPGTHRDDRALRSHKSMGWMLVRAGRCTGNLVCPPLLKESVEGRSSSRPVAAPHGSSPVRKIEMGSEAGEPRRKRREPPCAGATTTAREVDACRRPPGMA